MKNYFVLLFLLIGLISSCVSSKKFKELTEKNKICSEELEKYKRSSLDFESKFKDFKALYDVASADVLSMKKAVELELCRFSTILLKLRLC